MKTMVTEVKKHRRWASMSAAEFSRPFSPMLSLTSTFGTLQTRRIYKKRADWLFEVKKLYHNSMALGSLDKQFGIGLH